MAAKPPSLTLSLPARTSSRRYPTLLNFFIYNSTFGPREGQEHEKILFYMPDDVSLDTKIRNVGLSEAMVKFTETFSPDRPCDSVHTQRKRQLFFQPEPDYWMIMTVSLPAFERRTKDDKTVVEYREDDVQDSVYSAVLKLSYKMFRLFHSTFAAIVSSDGKVGLVKRLHSFFAKYIPALKWNHLDLLDVYAGISFLPLDKHTFLRIQSFVNQTEQTFAQIKYTAFLHTDQIVWSGLEQEDMRVVYKYLTTSLLPSQLDSETGMPLPGTGRSPPARDQSAHPGWFLTGPKDLKDPTKPIKTPKIYVNCDSAMEELHLVVYHALGTTVCFMVSADVAVTHDFYKALDSFVGPQLGTLSRTVQEQVNKRVPSTSEPQYKFIYFNHMNLAQKSTIHTKKPPHVTIQGEIMKLLCDIDADFAKAGEDGETIMKTTGDCWVVGKRSDQREFFVVLPQKNANLIEINEEVKRMCTLNFNNIFFLD
ncbi:vacuolar fusion protein CCZ1 homolog [Oscarella lobularis]|uniref:vacuolar fusion protein CCZ1 homolog n=1 Tax=Oscarella lobularis TaxID=121494 RepID=UPI003313274D